MDRLNALPAEYKESLELLEDLFEVQFCVYELGENWVATSGDTSESPETIDFLTQHFDPFQSLIASDKRDLLGIPLPSMGGETAAVADCRQLTEEQRQRFFQVAERLLKQTATSSQTMVFHQELSDLMEETTWLRNISQHIRMCDASQDASQLTSTLLPRLQEMVKSQAVGFIASPESGLENTWSGNAGDFDFELLIASHGKQALNRPVVVNNQKDSDSTLPTSYVLVHVGMADDHYGWLVASERLDQETLQEGVDFSTTGECEFGTSEAGLIQAASALLSTHIRNNTLFEAKEELLIGVIQAMSQAVDARDPYTKGHSDRVASYSRVIAEEMGFDQEACERIFLAGLLHDIGKIGIPDAVLNKTGKLTDEEYEIIKKHPQIGHNILSNLGELSFVLPAVLHHHERADGKGYPHGLTAEENSTDANIMAVADAFDAMTSTRSYRPGMPLSKAKNIIETSIGTQFAPDAAAAFLKAWPKIEEVSNAATSRCNQHREAVVALLDCPTSMGTQPVTTTS